MLLKVLQSLPTAQIPKLLLHFYLFVTATPHFQIPKSVLVSRAAITNDHKLGDLKQYKFITL